MKILNAATLKKFLRLAGEKLEGEWVLMGGTVLPLLGVDYRTTTDIDLAAAGDAPQSQTLELMKLAESLDLPVESINQAGAYFLKKIPNFRKHLVVLHRGASATVFRPDVTLYLLLKIGRLTESDLNDCLAYLRLAKKNGEQLDRKVVIAELQKKRAPKCSAEAEARAKQLREAIGGSETRKPKAES
jgi:hypothetical protein